jgi:hypothetical protein
MLIAYLHLAPGLRVNGDKTAFIAWTGAEFIFKSFTPREGLLV